MDLKLVVWFGIEKLLVGGKNYCDNACLSWNFDGLGYWENQTHFEVDFGLQILVVEMDFGQTHSAEMDFEIQAH
jgi:hypothetical protein